MFCKNCGKEIDDNASVCIHCGVPVKHQAEQTAVTGPKTNGLAIAGLVLSILWGTSLIGLILSIVGFQKSKSPEYNGSGRSIAIAGIVIGAIFVVIFAIVFGTCGVSCIKACSDLQNELPNVTSILMPLV